MRTHLLVLVMTVMAATAAQADTLLLRNGQRLQGTLISVDDVQVEFESWSGWLRRVVQVDRQEVVRIEFGDAAPAEAPPAAVSTIPRGMRERRVDVLANERWTDTGIEVREGQVVYFAASGEVRWGRNRRDGAAGERNSPSNPARPIPDRPAAALIGRVGEREDIFFIGDDREPFRMREGGRLYLGLNDDGLQDNSGALRVNVSY